MKKLVLWMFGAIVEWARSAELRKDRDGWKMAAEVWKNSCENALAEGKLADDFPAFLLATTAFQSLADKIAACPSRSTTPTETLDELERFLDAFADYLRTDRDEAVFDQNTRRAG